MKNEQSGKMSERKIDIKPAWMIKAVLVVMIIGAMTACVLVTKTWIPLDMAKVNATEKATTTVTIYKLTNGQERYMSLAGVLLNVAGAMTNEFNRQSGTGQNNPGGGFNDLGESVRAAEVRKNSSAFEKKLGDFNALVYFETAFNAQKNKLVHFAMESTYDLPEHTRIVNRLVTYDSKKLDSAYGEKLMSLGTKYLAAIKFQYGVGARVGKEQFSLTKKYRPYVRVVGLIKDVASNEFVWGNKIILFSQKVYKGKSEAKDAPGEEIVAELKLLIDQLVKILIDDMNGQRYESKDSLADYEPGVDDIL